jgi:branched-chain amino acid transport system ATP-binding protein
VGQDQPEEIVESARAATGDEPAGLLEVRGLSKAFRGLHALDGYELSLKPLTIQGVIGPNGAGKTTLFHVLSGFLRPTAGSVRFAGEDITGAPAWKVSRLGIGRTFQNIRLFDDLSVLDNVRVSMQRRWPVSLVATLVSAPSFRRREAELEDEAVRLLELFGLAGRRNLPARNLPYGDQRRLEIARAVAARPQLLLLDEPNAGMNPIETQDLLRLIRRLRDEFRITVILVAHDIPLVMGLCDRIQVLNYGRLIAEGDPASVRANPDVVAAYLGQARHA